LNRRGQCENHPIRTGNRRRLHGVGAVLQRRRLRKRAVPRDGQDLDDVGRCRPWCDRRRGPGAGRRSNEVRAAMSTIVLEAKGLGERYGDAVGVAGIDLSVNQGEVFGLLGPNGAGKTTTILMLLGLTEASEGSVSILGKDPLRRPLEVKREVGYLPDAVGFYDTMTGRENLAYTAKLAGMSRELAKERIAAALERVRLSAPADRPVATYSRGMRQRLGIAELLMRDCRIAILDEPT